MDKKRIVDSIYALRRIQRKNYPISKIKSVFERALFQLIKSRIEAFCFTNGESITNVRFECESDCRPFARANSLSIDGPKEAHRISDIIAWCNHRGQRIQWVNDLDLAEQIPVSMKKLLKLN